VNQGEHSKKDEKRGMWSPRSKNFADNRLTAAISKRQPREESMDREAKINITTRKRTETRKEY